MSEAQGLCAVLSSLLPILHSKTRAALTCANSKDSCGHWHYTLGAGQVA